MFRPTCIIVIILLMPQVVMAECDGSSIFRGGASLDGGLSYINQVSANENINISGELCPQAGHIGEIADLFVAFEVGDILYLLNAADELVVYSGTNPVPYRSAVELSAGMPLALFNGIVGSAIGQVNLYAAYLLDNEFYLDQQPRMFSVASEATISALQFFPQRDTITAGLQDELRISFDRKIDATTVQDTDLKVFGRWSGVLKGTLALTGSEKTLVFTPERALFAGEAVTVSLPAQAIAGQDGSDFASGATWSFWTGTDVAALQFTETAVVSARDAGSSAQIQTYGAYAGDLNEDGWSDFVVPNEISNDLRIFLNDGSGGYKDFTTVPIDGGNRPSPNEGGDFDGDGDIDFAVGSAGGNSVHIFLGDGQGGLVQSQNLVAGERVRGVCLLDFENDGDPDLIATAFTTSRLSLFRNEGNGTFVSAGVMNVGEGEWSCAAADMNGDGLTDIIVGTRTSDELIVLTSDGDGSFSEASRMSANGDPWMLAAGDLDRDGDVDIAAANASAKALTVAMGTGDGELLPATSYSLIENDDAFPLAVDLGDLDGDGDLDIVTSDFRTRLFLIHENLGDGSFLRLPNQLLAPQAASCAILHDRDNDGDLDITGIDEVEDVLLLYSH